MTIAAEISLKIFILATPSILGHLFNQLCPSYSKEPHTALNHIRQTYKDTSDNAVFMLASDYCTQILATSCPLIDREELPISICHVFMYGLDSCLLAGFCTHFPDYSKLQARTSTHQCKVLQEMLQAAISAKTEYTNIRTIVSEAIGAGQAFSAQVNASHAEKTISQYKGGDEGSDKSGSTASCGPLRCYGCGGPHPWLTLENGIYVIRCPNTGNPGVNQNVKKTLECIHNKRKKKQQDFQKCKNLTTTNYSDFDEARYFSLYLLPPMPPASAHQSPTSLVALLLLLLALNMIVVANLLFSCTMCKCCKLQPTVQFSLVPSKV